MKYADRVGSVCFNPGEEELDKGIIIRDRS